jgi:hypothetical protein
MQYTNDTKEEFPSVNYAFFLFRVFRVFRGFEL